MRWSGLMILVLAGCSAGADAPDALDAWVDRGPEPRMEVAMTHDSTRGLLLLQGGRSEGSAGLDDYHTDLWAWDGQLWIERHPGTSPRFGRSAGAMAHDPIRDRTALYGGTMRGPSEAELATCDDQWDWNGDDWLEIRPCWLSYTDQPPELPPPGPQAGHIIFFDPARERLRLASPRFQVWEWDGLAWTELPALDAPQARSAALAYDSTRGVLVAFGGEVGGVGPVAETYEWDGAAWTLRSTAGPSPRYAHAMVFDATRQRVMLFGGYTGTGSDRALAGDTWEWDGVSWSERTPAHSPSPRGGHGMVHDGTRQTVLLFGGIAGDYLGDTWEWDGDDWTRR